VLDAIPPESIPAAIARLAARAMVAAPVAPPAAAQADELLGPDAAAKLLHVSRRYVYVHAHELGAIRLGKGTRGRLRFSRAKLLARVAK
jgi:hypothetical protein